MPSDMDPRIAGQSPITVILEAGETYWFCTCGQSSHQPFCDGSHKGTAFVPKKFSVKQRQEATLCLCKRTRNAPFCDGSHQRIDWEPGRG